MSLIRGIKARNGTPAHGRVDRVTGINRADRLQIRQVQSAVSACAKHRRLAAAATVAIRDDTF